MNNCEFLAGLFSVASFFVVLLLGGLINLIAHYCKQLNINHFLRTHLDFAELLTQYNTYIDSYLHSAELRSYSHQEAILRKKLASATASEFGYYSDQIDALIKLQEITKAQLYLKYNCGEIIYKIDALIASYSEKEINFIEANKLWVIR